MRNLIYGLIVLSLVALGCINEEVEFNGKTTIFEDGKISRQGQIAIMLSGERTTANDSLTALEFFNANFISPDSAAYSYSQSMSDSTLLINWNADFKPNSRIIQDYSHVGTNGSKAVNSISLIPSDKWFFKDYSYEEAYSDPIDTIKVFSLIDSGFTSATKALKAEQAIKTIDDSSNVSRILNHAQMSAGINLYRLFLQKPDSAEYLLHFLEVDLHSLADSLADLSGSRSNIGLIDSLLLYYYGASADGVWDKIFANTTWLFGSYGLDEGAKNRFAIELIFPGILLKSNADEVKGNLCHWQFGSQSFLGKKKPLEASFRIWSIPKTILGLMILLMAVYLAFKPGKK